MLIGDLEISQTAVCQSGTCISGSFCSCSGSFTNIPVGRSVYALSADVQCNGGMGIFNITSPQISSIQSSLQQPPQSCMGACDSYSNLISGIDVTKLMVSGSLMFGASVNTVGPDLCMAGNQLKVLFTLQYSDD